MLENKAPSKTYLMNNMASDNQLACETGEFNFDGNRGEANKNTSKQL